MKIKLSSVAILCLYSAYAQEVTLKSIDISNEKVSEKKLSDSKLTIDLQGEVQPLTITEALKKEFYVDFKKSSEYESEVYIRGRGDKGVPVFLEGMRLNAGHNDSSNIFSLTDAVNLEVHRGASGATLGMGAMSGAVVVKYKDPQFNDSSEFKLSGFANLKSSFFSKEGYSTALGSTAYNNLVNISLSGSLSDYKNYEDGENNTILHSEYEADNINGNISLNTADDSFLYLRYMKSNSESSDPSTRFYNAAASVWTYTDRPNDEAKSYFIGFKKAQLGWFESFHIQGFKNEMHYDYNMKREAAVSEQQELFRDSETKGAKISVEKTIEEHLLSLATTYSKMEISNGLRRYDYATGTWGDWSSAPGIKGGEFKSNLLSLSDDIKYDKLFFNVAASYEYVRRSAESNIKTAAYGGKIPATLLDQVVQENTDEKDSLVSFNVTAGYEVSPAFTPYVKISNATRTPYLNEQYGNNPNMGTQVPNQDLDNEKVWGIDLGADGDIENFYYTSALYYQEYKDYIELVNTGYKTTATNLPIKQFINLDKAKVYGLELLLGYELKNNIFAELSYTYTKGENEDDNQPLAYISPQKVTLSLAQRNKKGFSWEIEQELVDRQDRVSFVNGEVETSGYGVTNLSASYGFGRAGLLKDITLSCELNNLFDKDYRTHLSKVSSTNYYLPDEAGINGVVALQIKF
jgi:iron complex outermembrane recepter protein